MAEKVHEELAKLLANIPWGAHYCYFYAGRSDLLDMLVPYFRAGLLNNECCVWITARRLDVKER
jgi:hypothetical protein